MAPNIGAVVLVILSSWTHFLPSLASHGSLLPKARLVLTDCCREEGFQRPHKQCWCSGPLEQESEKVDRLHFVLDESSESRRSSLDRKRNQNRINRKLISTYVHPNSVEYFPNVRNVTLQSILQRLSFKSSNKHQVIYKNWKLRPFSGNESQVSDLRTNVSQRRYSQASQALNKRNWNRSYSKNVFVFGKDDRTQIVPPLLRKFPYSSIVRLSTGCTGTLITPFHVLTAAHCVHDGREFRNKLEMMKVEIPDTIGIRVYYVEKIGIPNRWLNPRSRNYQQASFDYAVVRLSYGVHGRYQFLPLSVPTEATLHHNLQFLGFPNYGFGLWRSVCPARTTKTFMGGNLILARCDSAFGNSGAAIFTTDLRSKKTVVGILSSTVSMEGNPMLQRYSIITALTETKLLDICTEIGPVGVLYGVCPSPEMIPKRRPFQRKIKTIPFFG